LRHENTRFRGDRRSVAETPLFSSKLSAFHPECRQFSLEQESTLMAKPMSKSDLISKLAEENSDKLSRKDVKSVLETLATVGYKELKKNGVFLLPGFAKFVVIKKPATKERKGINPFTKEPTVFKAKPARKVLKARPVKAAKDAL
jgi:nucleoid DNA-binding protein